MGLALVSNPLAFVSNPLAFVSSPLAFVSKAATLVGPGETARFLPKLETLISVMDLPVASLIFAFWAAVNSMRTSLAILFASLSHPPPIARAAPSRIDHGDVRDL